MWRQASILLQAIRPQMARWWLKRGLHWVGAFLLLNLLAYLIGQLDYGQVTGQPNPVLLTAQIVVAALGSGIGLWLSWLIVARTNEAISAEFSAHPNPDWLATRVRFLVYQRQLLPVILFFPAVPWLASQLRYVIAWRAAGAPMASSLTDSLGLQYLFSRELHSLILYVWFCALLAISAAGLLQARRIALLFWLAPCLYGIPVLLSLGQPTVAVDQETFLRADLLTASVSLLAMLLWLLTVKSGPPRIGNALSWIVALSPPLLDGLRIWNSSAPGQPLLRSVLAVVHTLFYGFSSPPWAGEGLAAWMRVQFPQQQSLLGFAGLYANSVMQLLWLALLYALVWGIVLRPKQQELEQHPVVTALPQPQ